LPCPLSLLTLYLMRLCAKTGCAHEAVATCSFHYPLRQVWIAPLSLDPQPGSYDLCEHHADRLVAPLGWTLSDVRVDEPPKAASELAS
jgi:hypothetical protein